MLETVRGCCVPNASMVVVRFSAAAVTFGQSWKSTSSPSSRNVLESRVTHAFGGIAAESARGMHCSPRRSGTIDLRSIASLESTVGAFAHGPPETGASFFVSPLFVRIRLRRAPRPRSRDHTSTSTYGPVELDCQFVGPANRWLIFRKHRCCRWEVCVFTGIRKAPRWPPVRHNKFRYSTGNRWNSFFSQNVDIRISVRLCECTGAPKPDPHPRAQADPMYSFGVLTFLTNDFWGPPGSTCAGEL